MEGKRENIFLLGTEMASLVRRFPHFGYCRSAERSAYIERVCVEK